MCFIFRIGIIKIPCGFTYFDAEASLKTLDLGICQQPAQIVLHSRLNPILPVAALQLHHSQLHVCRGHFSFAVSSHRCQLIPINAQVSINKLHLWFAENQATNFCQVYSALANHSQLLKIIMYCGQINSL